MIRLETSVEDKYHEYLLPGTADLTSSRVLSPWQNSSSSPDATAREGLTGLGCAVTTTPKELSLQPFKFSAIKIYVPDCFAVQELLSTIMVDPRDHL
jgi:hypothetical protein